MQAIFKASYMTDMIDHDTGEIIMADWQFSFDSVCDDEAGIWGVALVKALTHGSEYSMDLDTLEVIAI